LKDVAVVTDSPYGTALSVQPESRRHGEGGPESTATSDMQAVAFWLQRLTVETAEFRKDVGGKFSESRNDAADVRKNWVEIRKNWAEIRKEFAEFLKEFAEFRKGVSEFRKGVAAWGKEIRRNIFVATLVLNILIIGSIFGSLHIWEAVIAENLDRVCAQPSRRIADSDEKFRIMMESFQRENKAFIESIQRENRALIKSNEDAVKRLEERAIDAKTQSGGN
jgi:cytochrome c-type biogenesis protein CcmH/NrfG